MAWLAGSGDNQTWCPYDRTKIGVDAVGLAVKPTVRMNLAVQAACHMEHQPLGIEASGFPRGYLRALGDHEAAHR